MIRRVLVLVWLLLHEEARAFSSRSTSRSTTNQKNDAVMLSKALSVIYSQGGTPGVLKRCQGMEAYPAATLVEATLQASKGDKGMASGILNAMIGYCCTPDFRHGGAERCIELMHAYDERTEKLRPDLVALCLAYSATHHHSRFSKESQSFLRRAEGFYSSDFTANEHDLRPSMDLSELERHGVMLLQDAEEFMVLSKPSGMVCYHPLVAKEKKSKQKRKQKDLSLEQVLLQSHVPLSDLNSAGRGFVHRIDRGTSGCILIAKTNRMHAILLSSFFLREVKKSYQALIVVPRELKMPKSGTIELDIDERPAKSHYKVEKDLGSIAKRICVETEQGRRHQVRIHCSRGLQSPILLDPLYGGPAALSQITLPCASEHQAANRFCLHASTLEIAQHSIFVQAPLSEWWSKLETQLLRT